MVGYISECAVYRLYLADRRLNQAGLSAREPREYESLGGTTLRTFDRSQRAYDRLAVNSKNK